MPSNRELKRKGQTQCERICEDLTKKREWHEMMKSVCAT